MHHVDAYKTYAEKAWQQLHKNAVSSIKPVLEATPYKGAAIRPPTNYHEPNMQETDVEVRASL